jgi:hypothetical protein
MLKSNSIRLPSGITNTPTFKITGDPIRAEGDDTLIWLANQRNSTMKYGVPIPLGERFEIDKSFKNLGNYKMRDLENPKLRRSDASEVDISDITANLPTLSLDISAATTAETTDKIVLANVPNLKPRSNSIT